ncbi:hypothetical protein J6Y73_00965 [bacterium]|nr:hypothetical protein [bacterium]
MNIRSKTIKIIFSLVFIFILSSCKENNKYDQNKKEGYKISVRYEANGGTYLDREGITLIDMFNPDDYPKDGNDIVHIKLIEPTDARRPSGSSEGIYITKTNSFLVGWYKERTIKTNTEGNPVDENGNVLVLKDDKYYLKDDDAKEAYPAYSYSGYWDFENDTLDYTYDMDEYEMTLYALWSTYFEFDYYYQNGTSWEYLGNTTFDYKTTNKEGSLTSDKDTIFLPRYENGAMNYTHKYQNNSLYSFPKIDGYTFKAAYLDMDMTQEITGEYEHTGSINYLTGEAVNPVVNIYITLEEGEYYYISEAKQLVDNPNLNGIYVIENDLDFNDLEWPTIFSLGTFNGKIYSSGDNTYKLSNINIYHSSDNAKVGGIFGAISSDALIKDIVFENVTLDLAYVGRRNRDTNFGLLSGNIENKSSLEDIKLSGTIKIGAITIGDNYSINLIANGDNNDNIDLLEPIHIVIYGIEQGDSYSYTVNPDEVMIDTNGYISITSVTGLKKTEESYVIQ